MTQMKTVQRIFVLVYLLFACILIMNPLIAIDPQDKQDVKNDLRILELLPNLLCPLAVDPGIPSNFVAVSPNGILDPHDLIYWGPKDVVKAYFEDPSSLKEPLIRVQLSGCVAQTGPNSFHKVFMEYLKKLKDEDPKGFCSIETQWGDYPVIAIRGINDGQLNFTAWVGLNDPEAGWTLVFDLVYPDEKDRPNKEDRQLWENLLTKTTQLKDGDYFKAYGQDLQEGYTLVNVGGAKLKMLAEKRQSDGTIQVVVIPENSDVKFNYIDMMECAMGAKWKHAEPMVKIYGEILLSNKNIESTMNYVTSIFFKTVQEFSFKKEEGKKFLIFQKKCDKMD